MATPDPRLRVMIDANVLIAGMGWPRFCYEVLQHAARGDFRLVLSPYVIDEARARLGEIAPDALEPFEQFLQVCGYGEAPTPAAGQVAAHATLVRDRKDVPVALAALNADVDVLISQDRDLTDRDATNQTLHQRLTILLPGTFLRAYMGWTSDQLEAIRQRTWRDLEE